MYAPSVSQAAVLSIQVGLWCSLLGLPFAVLFGWGLARKQFVGKSLLGTLLMAPLVLPPVVTGVLLLRAFSPRHFFGNLLQQWGLFLPFTFVGVVVAAFFVGLPLYVMAVRNAFEAVDPRYEEVSLTLGHGRWATFFRISLPLALPGIFAGALLAFARALGEFGATIVLAGNIEGKTRTLALAIYTLLESPNGEAAITQLLAVSLGFAFGALLLYEALTRIQRRLREVDLEP